MDLMPYTGIGQSGAAYRRMFEGDCHAPCSVDRVLFGRMVRICPETADCLYGGFTPAQTGYMYGMRPELERLAAGLETVEEIAAFCVGVAARAPAGLEGLLVGGTEEQIIQRGSDWCTDLARVACALCQVVGLPARIVYLADVERAYSGHAIVEAHRGGAWGAVDPTGNVVYQHPDGRPATTWELTNYAGLVMRHGPAPFTTPGQFRRAAVANYSISDRACYDYTVSGLNDYYRSILGMSERSWPGGLRWLHGEDGG
jgi:hypothetical protein